MSVTENALRLLERDK